MSTFQSKLLQKLKCDRVIMSDLVMIRSSDPVNIKSGLVIMKSDLVINKSDPAKIHEHPQE